MLELSQLKQGVVLEKEDFGIRIVQGLVGEAIIISDGNGAYIYTLEQLNRSNWHRKSEEPKRWRPREDGGYFHVDYEGGVRMALYTEQTDYERYEFGNCFETLNEAQDAAEKVKELLLSL